jgi:hypothetical protein
MPAFGEGYSDDDIAAVANYVTARFGAKGAHLTGSDVANLRMQATQLPNSQLPKSQLPKSQAPESQEAPHG